MGEGGGGHEVWGGDKEGMGVMMHHKGWVKGEGHEVWGGDKEGEGGGDDAP